MKKSIGISILFVLFAIPAFAQDEEIPDYAVTCYPVTITGKIIYDGYYTESVKYEKLTLEIYGYYYLASNTADRVKGGIFDNEGSKLARFSGNIVWDENVTKASIIGTLESTDDAEENHRALYFDGTLKKSRNKFTLSAKGGETDTYNQIGFPFVASFSKISSSSCLYQLVVVE